MIYMYRIIIEYNNGIIVDDMDNYYDNAIDKGKKYCNNTNVVNVSIYNIYNNMQIAQGSKGLLIDTLFGEIL